MRLTAKISVAVILVISFLSLFAPIVTTYDPHKIDLDSLRQPPSSKHLFGTDNKGRDILSRILHGGRISISISVISAALCMCMGLLVGLISGYFGGKIDALLMAAVDLVLAFPSLLLAIGISVIFTSGILTVIIALSAVGWASFARLIRGRVLSIREASFIEAARSIGCSNTRIIFVHILPQCIPVALILAGLKLGGFILAEAALSFLGLGAQPPTATWGSMISANRVFIHSAPWMILSPGIMIALTAISFNLIADEIRQKYENMPIEDKGKSHFRGIL